MSQEEVKDFVDRYMPAYFAYRSELPDLYTNLLWGDVEWIDGNNLSDRSVSWMGLPKQLDLTLILRRDWEFFFGEMT